MSPADTLHHAVQLLAGTCDGAVQRDGAGFNRFDSDFGRRLASLPPDAWTPRMRRAAWVMLRKYREQLTRAGLDYATIAEPPAPPDRQAAGATPSRTPGALHPWRQPVSVGPAARTLERLDDGALAVRFAYDAALVARVKAIPGSRWMPAHGERYWRVPASDMAVAQIQALVRDDGFEAPPDVADQLESVAREVSQRRAASAATEADLEIAGLGGTLRPFQLAAVAYCLRVKRALICDEMGLGKTVEALALLQAAEAFPAVVVCPASLKPTWLREARKWLPGRQAIALDARTLRVPELFDVLIVNYDLLGDRRRAPGPDAARVAELRAEDPALTLEEAKAIATDERKEGPALRPDLARLHERLRAVVLDESHYIKSTKARRTRLAKQLCKGRPYRLLLTGTPILNRPEEALSQLQALDRLQDLGGYVRVRDRYAPYDWNLGKRTAAHLDELHQRLRGLCYVRRTKAEVLTELPPKQRTTVALDLDNRAEYARAERDLIAWLREHVACDRDFLASIAALPREAHAEAIRARQAEATMRALRAEKLVRLNALMRLAARGKLAAAREWIDSFLEAEEKLVLFAHHREVVEGLAQHYQVPTITGDTPIPERQAAVDRFQTDPDCRMIACNIQAGGVGLTLTAASNVAFLELPWNPAAVDQATDRVHRIGQRNSVMAWFLLGASTIDFDIAELIDAKRDVVSALTDGRDPDGGASILDALVSRLAGDAPRAASAEADAHVGDLWA